MSRTLPPAKEKPRSWKAYVGDGVYVEFDGFGFVLTTENGISVTNRIVLELEVFRELTKFVHHIASWNPGDP